MVAVTFTGPQPVTFDPNIQVVHSNATVNASGSITTQAVLGTAQVELIINITGVPTGTSPTLQFSIVEVDPVDLTTPVGSATNSNVFNAAGYQIVELTATKSSAFKVSWTIGGTSGPTFTGVNVSVSSKSGGSSGSGGTVTQGNAGSIGQAWYTRVTDGTNGPVAVKAASTAALGTDPSFVVALSPNSPLYGESFSGAYPQPNQYDTGSTDLIRIDSFGNLSTRSAVFTDEGSLFDGFSGSSLFTSLTGTVTFTNGSSVVTGSGTTFTTQLGYYSYIKLDAHAESAWARVVTVDSDTQVTLASPYTGANGSGAASKTQWVPVTGSGGSISVASSQLSIASGGTNGALTGVYAYLGYPPVNLIARFSITQRIANQTITWGLVDSPTSIQRQVAFVFTGTNNTQVICRTSVSSSANDTQSFTYTLPNGGTTATQHQYSIYLMGDGAQFMVDNQSAAFLQTHIPEPYGVLQVTGQISNQAAVTTTTLAIDAASWQDYDRVDVVARQPIPGLLQVTNTPAVDSTVGGSITGNGQIVQSSPLAGVGTVGIQVTGTWAATLQFEGSIDGTTWVSITGRAYNSTTVVTNVTGNGLWRFSPAGLQYIRVRCSAFTSGTAVVSIRTSVGSGMIVNTETVTTALASTTLSGTANTIRGNVTQYTADGTAAAANSLPVIAQLLATKVGANTLDRLWAGPTNADGEAVETVGALVTKTRLYGFNGTTWDRLKSSTANGLVVDVSRVQGSVAVTGTFWQATQPVSIAAAVDVSDRAARLLGVVYGSQAQQLKQTATNYNLATELYTGATAYDARQVRALTASDVVTAAQGTAAASTAPWSVRLSDGTSFYNAPTSGQLPAALVGSRLDTNVGSWLGSTAPTVGSKTSANSIPVVISSDQDAVAVKGASTPTDAFANPTTAVVSQDFLMGWNGASWDRLISSTANGLDVDVTRVSGNVTVVQPTPASLTATVTQGPGSGAAATYWFNRITDGTNTMPTMDVAARRGYVQLTDGTNNPAVKAASTAAIATDPALVVAISPNNSITTAGNATPSDAYANPTTAQIGWSLQGLWDGSQWVRAKGTAALGQYVSGPVATGAAVPANPVYVGASDGTNVQPLRMKAASTPAAATDPSLVVSISPNIGTQGLLPVTLGAPGTLDVFGHLVTSDRVPQLQANFYQAAPSSVVSVTTANGGGSSQGTGYGIFSTGASTNGSVRGATFGNVTYSAHYEVYGAGTMAFTSGGVATSTQRLGLFNSTDGLFFGYNATAFGVGYLVGGGALQWVAQASWNTDTCSGQAGSKFTRGGVVEALDPTKLNFYRVRFGWLGIAPFVYEVLSPDGNFVVVHVQRFPNLQATPSITNPNLPFQLDLTKTAGNTNIIANVGCWVAGVTAGSTPYVSGTGTITANGGAVQFAAVGVTAATINITGTWNGTLAFQYHIGDNNWITDTVVNASTLANASTTTANGAFKVNLSAARVYRVTATAWTSGTASIAYSGGQGTGSLNATITGTTTSNQGTANTLANAWPTKVTDGTNTMPTMDAVARKGFHAITDGTNGPAAVKAASTAAVAADPALVVTLSPNNPMLMPPDVFPGVVNITARDVASTSTAGANGQVYITGSPTANSSVAWFTTTSYSSYTIQVTGSWTGTLQVEVSYDGGTTYFARQLQQVGVDNFYTTFTSNFTGVIETLGATIVRVRSVGGAWTGTATVKPINSFNQSVVHNISATRLSDNAGNGPVAVKAASTAAAAADPALVVAVSPNNPVTQERLATGNALATAAMTTSSSAIVAANANRKRLFLRNTSTTVPVYVAFGQTATTSAAFVLAPGQVYSEDTEVFTGAINGITASGSATVAVQELQA